MRGPALAGVIYFLGLMVYDLIGIWDLVIGA